MDEKKANLSTNITETDDSHSMRSNDILVCYTETHQVVNPNNLNEISPLKESIECPSIKPLKSKVRAKRKPGRPAKRGRKPKGESRPHLEPEEILPKSSNASREEKKLEYYNMLIRRQEEREMK